MSSIYHANKEKEQIVLIINKNKVKLIILMILYQMLKEDFYQELNQKILLIIKKDYEQFLKNNKEKTNYNLKNVFMLKFKILLSFFKEKEFFDFFMQKLIFQIKKTEGSDLKFNEEQLKNIVLNLVKELEKKEMGLINKTISKELDIYRSKLSSVSHQISVLLKKQR